MNKYTFLVSRVVRTGTKTTGKVCILTCIINSVIQDFPYPGKFEQIDFNVELTVNAELTEEEINNQLPAFAQAWVNATYPNT